MNYLEYVEFRESFLVNNPEVIDLGETNLYKMFPLPEVTEPLTGHINGNIHRCHLVEDFLKLYDLDVDKKLVGVSAGVRDSLKIAFNTWGDRKWLIPEDNYPFYSYAAQEAGVSFSVFPTLSSNPVSSGDIENIAGDVLLITYPMKPSGESFDNHTWDHLKAWLSKDSSRILIVDTVYSFDLKSSFKLWELFHETQQVVVLYSLSKSFAAPKVFGVAFTYDNGLKNAFKNVERNEHNLKASFALLNGYYGTRPVEIKEFITIQFSKTLGLNLFPAPVLDKQNPTYLLYVKDGSFEELLKQNILAIPPSVYGSSASGVIISTLLV